MVDTKQWVRKLFSLHLFGLFILLATVLMTVFTAHIHQDGRVRAAGPGMPYVQANRIFDSSGHPLLLHGAHIASSLERIHPTAGYIQATAHLTRQEFDIMHTTWKMNALRLSTSPWVWKVNPHQYIATLQKIVATANQSGLYVIISVHEDLKTGLPSKEPCGMHMPTPEAGMYLQAVASAFKYNPMVMFDVYNEPYTSTIRNKTTAADWDFWLHGGATPGCMRVLGMQDLVNIVRQQGAKQIVIVEALDNWFQTIGSIRVQDPNVVYSVHQYFLPNIRTPTSWDLKFGNFSQQVPLFIGEWAVQVHTIYPSRCSGLTPTQATQLVNEFLAYMQQKMVSWTAYDFGPDQLIVNYNYTPTELTGPWTCGDLHSTAGMGNLILQYLTHGLL